jgi:transposase/ubiquinone/menaquinone biosynthesis C-methylase UbiE
MRYELTDFEWAAIKPFLPNKPRGVTRVNDRRVLNGIFWVLRSGAPWRDLPLSFGPRTTCYNRFVRWRRAGVWDRIMNALSADHDPARHRGSIPLVRSVLECRKMSSGGQNRWMNPKITFEDGAAYERMMGTWSRIAGQHFVDWLQPRPGMHWIDVGCGNGAFTELLIDRCAAAKVDGIDPSQAQIDYARSRRQGSAAASFHRGDALSLPFQDDSADAATMALVIFFLSVPAKGVAEMSRVVRPGGLVAAYAWDLAGGGLPQRPIGQEFLAMGVPPAVIPSADASKLDVMAELWSRAGLREVEATAFAVRRTFESFENFWEINLLAPGVGPVVARMKPEQVTALKERVRAHLTANASGQITYEARANAVKGVVA